MRKEIIHSRNKQKKWYAAECITELMKHLYLKWRNTKGIASVTLAVLPLLFAECGNTSTRQKEEGNIVNLGAKLKATRQAERQPTKELDQIVDDPKALEHAIENPEALPNTKKQKITTTPPPDLCTVASPLEVARKKDDDKQAAEFSEKSPLSPQEILERVLNNPDTVLIPDQSISVINHGTQLGEQNATNAADKVITVFMGNTGAGKSTTINCLVGCKMKAEIDELEEEKISVDPESNIAEVMSVGHGGPSKTFLPQIVQNPNNPDRVYCDCPGFFDNRKPEINITNAINIKKVLQQARGVKVVFLTEYADLVGSRGRNIKDMANLCEQMFGDGEAGVNNLRDCQTAVLLGLTKAPLYTTSGQPLSLNSIRLRLSQSGSDVAQILANRVFLFDPLDRGNNNPDFWSLERCRTEIAQLNAIPQQETSTLLQTVLNNDDRMHLLDTVRQLNTRMINAIQQGDETVLGQHWQLLQRLQVIQHPEIDLLMQGEVSPAINNELERLGDVERWTEEHDFDQADAQIAQLTRLVQQLPGAKLDLDLEALRQRLAHYKAQYEDQRNMNVERERLQRELAQLKNSTKEPPTAESTK